MMLLAIAAGTIILIATGVLTLARTLRQDSRDLSVDLGRFGKFEIGSPGEL